ncbi:hypothetical protein [Klebsiella oxytoca]|uniref:hypothetical protein n=1 Tax=Klebsiella oxytoca TaxID=571 RepID=UPI00157A5957|nr:hypothetical protein [Klebsiella oxytoca]
MRIIQSESYTYGEKQLIERVVLLDGTIESEKVVDTSLITAYHDTSYESTEHPLLQYYTDADGSIIYDGHDTGWKLIIPNMPNGSVKAVSKEYGTARTLRDANGLRYVSLPVINDAGDVELVPMFMHGLIGSKGFKGMTYGQMLANDYRFVLQAGYGSGDRADVRVAKTDAAKGKISTAAEHVQPSQGDDHRPCLVQELSYDDHKVTIGDQKYYHTLSQANNELPNFGVRCLMSIVRKSGNQCIYTFNRAGHPRQSFNVQF